MQTRGEHANSTQKGITKGIITPAGHGTQDHLNVRQADLDLNP